MSEPSRRPAVVIESLDVRRAPGIPRGFHLPGFSPGITIIHGPNGSGKSTAARAIHSLFWPDRNEDHIEVNASFQHDRASWTVTRHGRRAEATRDGVGCPPLTFPQLDRDTRDRYLLALHDLIRAEDTAFAGLIAREMSGGYDIEAAARTTGFEKSINAKQLRSQLDAADLSHQNLLANQASLSDERDRLAELEKQTQAVAEARLRGRWLELINSWLEARSHYDEAVDTANRFDPVIEKSKAGDSELIQTWIKDEPRLRAEHQTLNRQRERLIERRNRVGLDESVLSRRAIAAVSDRLTALRISEQARFEQEQALATARSVANALRAEIGSHLPERLQLGDALRILTDYGNALAEATEADRISDAEARLAGYIERPDAVQDAHALRTRLDVLVEWAQTPPPAAVPAVPRMFRLVAILAAVVIIAEAALLGYFWRDEAYALAAIGIAFSVAAFLIKGPAPEPDRRPEITDRYQRYGFPEPLAWEADDVATAIAESVEAIGDAHIAARSDDFWRTFGSQLEEREVRQKAATQRTLALEAALGTELSLDPNSLRLLSEAVENALTAARHVTDIEARVAVCEEASTQDLSRLLEALAPLPAPETSVIDVVTGSAALRELNDRLAECESLDRQITELDTQIQSQILPVVKRLESECDELIKRYGGLTIDEIAPIARQHQAWIDAQAIMKQCHHQLELARHRIDGEFNEDEWGFERVERESAECRAIVDRAAETDREIGSINTRVSLAENSDQVARSLQAVEEARDKLIDRRHEQLRNAVGKLVLDEVRSVTRDANLPQVAKRARELFVTFTQGQYELRPVPGKEPRFSARSAELGVEQSINELSSGTRLQLLMAVRLAFMEHQEAECQLPLIFDETLANADDDRADSLIDATLEIVAAGRQVFYFTAQMDEVEKWRARAAAAGVEPTIIDLAEVRGLARRQRTAIVPFEPLPRLEVPPPNGAHRRDYRTALGAPDLDIWGGGADSTHLWYLIEDLDELHRLMTQHHVWNWGQVRNYASDGSALTLGLDRDTCARLFASAECVDSLIALLRIGRDRPVDTAALVASGQVPGSIELECFEQIARLNGDARDFIAYLNNPGLPGIGRTRINRLRDYFEEMGHIVEDQPLPADQIRARLSLQCADAIHTGVLTWETIDRLLDDAAIGPSGEPRSFGQPTTLLPSGE